MKENYYFYSGTRWIKSWSEVPVDLTICPNCEGELHVIVQYRKLFEGSPNEKLLKCINCQADGNLIWQDDLKIGTFVLKKE